MALKTLHDLSSLNVISPYSLPSSLASDTRPFSLWNTPCAFQAQNPGTHAFPWNALHRDYQKAPRNKDPLDCFM